jgi:hypothetical protein
MHEEWIQQLCDFLLVCKLQGTVEWDPAYGKCLLSKILLSDPRKTYHTPLRCIGPILTTCLIFSLLRIPSRRPRVMPATLSSLVPLIKWLSEKLSAVSTTVLCKFFQGKGQVPCHQPQRCASHPLVLQQSVSRTLIRVPGRSKSKKFVPSRRATHTLLASTWKQRVPSSSHRVAVTLGFIPGGATCPVWSK